MKTGLHTFHYSHLLPKRPPVCPRDPEQEKTCACGAKFSTRSRVRERCDACREARRNAKQAKANEKTKARRRKAKGL